MNYKRFHQDSNNRVKTLIEIFKKVDKNSAFFS